jgi:hypothetical protein
MEHCFLVQTRFGEKQFRDEFAAMGLLAYAGLGVDKNGADTLSRGCPRGTRSCRACADNEKVTWRDFLHEEA